MDWTELLGLGASAMSGGLFGVIGAGISAFFKHKQRQQEAVEKAADREYQLKLMDKQMEVASQGGSWDAMSTTHRAEASLNTQDNYKWVNAIKSLFRPFLTVFLWIAVYVQMVMLLDGQFTDYLSTSAEVQTLFDPNEMVDLLRYIIYTTVFSASTATTWWYGERSISLPSMKNR